MTSWGQGSFGINRADAERFIFDKFRKKPEAKAPEIDYSKMQKGPEQVNPPQFHGPLHPNTLSGEDKCSQSQ